MDSVGGVAAAGSCPTLEPCRWSRRWLVGGQSTDSFSDSHVGDKERRCDVPGPMPAPVRSGNSPAETLFSRFPAHCVVLMFNSETCQRIVRGSTGMSVFGDSHGKGNGIRYVLVVARFWCVATSRAWKAGTTCRPQMGLDGQQQFERIRHPGWLPWHPRHLTMPGLTPRGPGPGAHQRSAVRIHHGL